MSTTRRKKTAEEIRTSPTPSPTDSEYCPYFHHTVELLGRRWNGVILRLLLQHERRFSELRSAVPGLSDRLLTERLHELEQEGLVQRRVDDEVINYRLTDKGTALEPVLQAITSFAQKWAEPEAPQRPGRLGGLIDPPKIRLRPKTRITGKPALAEKRAPSTKG